MIERTAYDQSLRVNDKRRETSNAWLILICLRSLILVDHHVGVSVRASGKVESLQTVAVIAHSQLDVFAISLHIDWLYWKYMVDTRILNHLLGRENLLESQFIFDSVDRYAESANRTAFKANKEFDPGVRVLWEVQTTDGSLYQLFFGKVHLGWGRELKGLWLFTLLEQAKVLSSQFLLLYCCLLTFRCLWLAPLEAHSQ